MATSSKPIIENPTGLGVAREQLSEEEKYSLIYRVMAALNYGNEIRTGGWRHPISSIKADQLIGLIQAIMLGRKVRMYKKQSIMSKIKKVNPALYDTLCTDYVILHLEHWSSYSKLEGELGFVGQ